MGSLHSWTLRTSAVADRAGYSVQQIRNLERDGVLPPAARTGSGYRCYGDIHVRSALAYRALAAAIGPVDAKEVVRAAHRPAPTRMLALLDAAHARLHAERAALREAEAALRAISGEPITDVRASDAMTVSELAAALGVRPSTLRHWDAERLVVPDRAARVPERAGRASDPAPPRDAGARRYSPSQVRDARIVQQLRAAGYGIGAIRALMPELRGGHRLADVASALTARNAAITARSKALLDASAALRAILTGRASAGREETHSG
ncbi:MerR family transcriptional regulator [Actinomadura logoneensis]|uniref:MerR family transcriptional regulator n=1 Tax=Actinomadura logoneensis TaxID=2293572 RepID=A0A372JCZ9_9ACTN|nr:MerR family transcriptional regulator [Actinomadura logoneensis]RFU37706.1 MerR family transcriptional regulator [Actinomadura logoneensis]